MCWVFLTSNPDRSNFYICSHTKGLYLLAKSTEHWRFGSPSEWHVLLCFWICQEQCMASSVHPLTNHLSRAWREYLTFEHMNILLGFRSVFRDAFLCNVWNGCNVFQIFICPRSQALRDSLECSNEHCSTSSSMRPSSLDDVTLVDNSLIFAKIGAHRFINNKTYIRSSSVTPACHFLHPGSSEHFWVMDIAGLTRSKKKFQQPGKPCKLPIL